MASINFYAVITTIQGPTPSVLKLAEKVSSENGKVLLVGDQKGPIRYPVEGVELIKLEDQWNLPHSLAALLPVGHYARKNLGYLEAIRRGADCIYDTDDDNSPLASWRVRSNKTMAFQAPPQPWFNVYQAYTRDYIWPRGFPLEKLRGRLSNPIAAEECPQIGAMVEVDAPIQQGLVNRSPDVDAVWRLIFNREIMFHDGPSLYLLPGTWCPFNSQSTWWWPAAFHLMYLPSHCTFRVTDIWRSFVAQRCLWAMGYGLVFHAPEVEQARNVHDSLQDFADEIPGFLGNSRFAEVLSNIELPKGYDLRFQAMRLCYEALISAGFLPQEEITLVDAWLHDIKTLFQKRESRI